MSEYHTDPNNTNQEYHSVPFLSICAIADSYDHSLTIDRILYEMTGDLECAAIMSRLRYWFSPSKKNGQTRAKSRHDGKLWMARKDDEWEEEACVRTKQMPRVKKKLKKLGLVDISIYKWDGNPTTHWHLNVQRFTEMYNETIKKMISKYPNGGKGNHPMGEKETPQWGNSINKHIPQASSSSSLEEHMDTGCEQDALSIEKDELGNPVYIPPPLKGSAKKEHEILSNEQKRAYSLLLNVEPPNIGGQRFNAVEAIKIAKNVGLDRVRKGIIVYQQRLERGFKPKSFGALSEIIASGWEPESEQATKNRAAWKKGLHKKFPEGSYEENQHEVVFKFYPYKPVAFSMSEGNFRHQIDLNLEHFKEGR